MQNQTAVVFSAVFWTFVAYKNGKEKQLKCYFAMLVQGSVAMVNFKNNKVFCNYYVSTSIGLITNKTSQQENNFYVTQIRSH